MIKPNVRFICQITENYLKVTKCLLNNSQREFVGLELEALPSGVDDKKITQSLTQSLKKLGYDNNPLILSLPRNQATSRNIKVPTGLPQEIKKMVYLQASRYLPYPANELITGYQIISTDKEGYSNLNLVIVHKNTVERYLKIFRELNIRKFTIALSSYGICNLYGYIKQNEPQPTMVIDIDSDAVELVIVSQQKLLFSRHFKLDWSKAGAENLFMEEINKTQDLYLKEPFTEAPEKIVLIGAGKIAQELTTALNKQINLPLEALSYPKEINLPENLLNNILNSQCSFTSLIGLGIKETGESLHLLPEEIKEEIKRGSRRKENLHLVLLIFSIVFIWVLGVNKNLDNKAKYLKRIKSELNKISQEAIPLEEIEKRVKLLESRAQKKVSSLDTLYEIHKVMPLEISLVNFNYEEDIRITMRGETPELNPVFAFVSGLEKSPVFNNFNVKVRYATKKKTQVGEIVDFEIICLKK